MSNPEPGKRLLDAFTDIFAYMMQNVPALSGLTAAADGLQADATQLNQGLNEVETVAGSTDSVQLPAAIQGTVALVANPSANTLTIFGKEGRTDTINGVAGATGVTQATLVHALYFCPADTKWYRVLSA